MSVEKRRLFEEAKNRWPLHIRALPTNGYPPFVTEPCLVNVHRNIEAACSPKGEWTEEDNWTALANWSFHQALGAVVDQSKAEQDVYRDEVTFEMFDKRMRSNLAIEHWADERLEYEENT